MTFDQIVQEILERMSLTSADAKARVEQAVNRHYRRITSLLGMETTRVATVNGTLVHGTSLVTFLGVEKLDRVFDTSDATHNRLLPEISLHRMRVTDKGSGAPGFWAMQEAGPDFVVVLFDTVAQQDYGLQADGWTTRVELADDDEPLFPASFHDCLTWFTLAEELLRKEKFQLASAYETKADGLLDQLRFHLADTHTRELRQASHPLGSGMGGGTGGGGVNQGGSSYTQTGDLTFDRPGTGVPPFFVAPDNNGKVDNLNADLLDDEDGADFHDASQLTGTLPIGQLPDIPANTVLGRASDVGAGTVTPLQVWTGLATESGRLLIPNGGVLEPLIADLAVATAKLADLAVTTAKIANNAITAAKIVDDTITAIKLHTAAGPRLVGRSGAGAGAGEEISIGQNLSLAASLLKVTAGGSDTNFQFNDGTALGGAAVSWDKVNGALNYPGNPRCSLWLQTFTPTGSVWNVLPFPNEDFDVGNLHSTVTNTSRITIPTGFGGVWLVGGTSLTQNAVASGTRLRFKKNGTTTVSTETAIPNPGSGGILSGGPTGLLTLVAGDYIEFELFQLNASVNGGSGRDQAIQFWAVRLLG